LLPQPKGALQGSSILQALLECLLKAGDSLLPGFQKARAKMGKKLRQDLLDVLRRGME